MPYVIEAGSGRVHVLLDAVGRALVGAPQANGTTTMTTVEMPKDAGLPAHGHERTYTKVLAMSAPGGLERLIATAGRAAADDRDVALA